ncbi:MAG: Glyoxalase-like domain [Phormidesmis priestleyi Ana]|uniref:Glyoxalase-like domain n=1 Tax=Phormidesmis priestleyi Ana TaxID=1666911 RepID=A0A0P7Z0B0_9CYAN|nr:MAG: Glyoxalase-like domain [Phormidesmis priestleyi Ana]
MERVLLAVNMPVNSLSTPCQFKVVEVFVAIASPRLEHQVSFYRDFLAIAPRLHTATYAEFHLPGLRLALFSPMAEHAPEFASSPGSPVSLCLEVKDLEQAIACLNALGYPPPGEIIMASHGQEIYAYDPDGNRLILHQSKPLG